MTRPVAKPVQSMTGFSQAEGETAGGRLKVEIKTLNHRFLDAKVRLPRELSSAEIPLRAALAGRFTRGAVEIKVERMADPARADESAPRIDRAQARRYLEEVRQLQSELGLPGALTISDLLALPEVLGRGQETASVEDPWPQVEPVFASALQKLSEMRTHEGQALARTLGATLDELDARIRFLREKRKESEGVLRARARERVQAVFEAFPIANASVEAALESRVSQELALLLDRTDIEEELIRFQGHLDHFRKVLGEGGPVGRKLDFILQELNREINTLGNKAQDLGISEETVSIKVRIEQLREQVMNLE